MEKDASKLYLREESRTSAVLVGENDKFCVLTRRMVYGVTLFAVVIFVINLSSIALAVSNYNKLLDMQENLNNKCTNSKSSAFQMVEPTKTMRSNFKKLHAGARPNPSPDDGVTWTRSGFLKTAKPSISTENVSILLMVFSLIKINKNNKKQLNLKQVETVSFYVVDMLCFSFLSMKMKSDEIRVEAL